METPGVGSVAAMRSSGFRQAAGASTCYGDELTGFFILEAGIAVEKGGHERRGLRYRNRAVERTRHARGGRSRRVRRRLQPGRVLGSRVGGPVGEQGDAPGHSSLRELHNESFFLLSPPGRNTGQTMRIVTAWPLTEPKDSGTLCLSPSDSRAVRSFSPPRVKRSGRLLYATQDAAHNGKSGCVIGEADIYRDRGKA